MRALTTAEQKVEYPPAAHHMDLVHRKHDFYEVVILTVQKYCGISTEDSSSQSVPASRSQSQSDEVASVTTL